MQQEILDKYLSSEFKEIGTLFQIFKNEESAGKIGNFVVPIGKNERDGIVYRDLSQISHILISGTTGSGKTAFIQSLMISLMLSMPTENVKFIIYDSKQIDYMFFQGIPQLIIPILTDSKKTMGAINWALSEANNRIKLFAENAKYINEAPHIFIILDDYSALASCDDIECLVNLLKIGRRANIHCILSTSTPTSNVISTEIKANVPCRIAFHTTQKSVSRMILDENGAELLQIPGEMIFKGQNQNVKCSSFFITDDEIKQIVDNSENVNDISVHKFGEQAKAIFGNKSNSENTGYDASIMEYIMKKELNVFSGNDEDDADELLPQAIDLALELGQISTSMIQRKLRIGYSRAGKIIDQMETMGIISGANGSEPREVLVTKDEHRNMICSSDTDFKNDENVKSQNIKEDVAELRPFPRIESCGESIEIKDNLIYVKKVTKRQGPYIHTAEYTFDNRRLCGIVYTKPKLFSKGSFTFILKSNSWNVNDQRIDEKYEADLPKTELSLTITKNNADIFEHLAKQIADDCSIEVSYR